MPSSAQPPVFFLAFANAMEQDYLQLLKKESAGLRDVLLQLDMGRQIKLVREESTDNEDLPKLFNLFRDQIFVFHYGGHADGRHLMFENEEGHSQGILELLKWQQNLKLLFLNGCSTQEQAYKYLEAGMPIVIATTRAIPDEDAAHFSRCFYENLAHGSSIKKAFESATKTLEEKGGYAKGSGKIVKYRGLNLREEKQEIPWELYVHEEKSFLLDWVIPEGVKGEREVLVILAASEDFAQMKYHIENLRGKLNDKNEQLKYKGLPDTLRTSLEKERLEISAELEEELAKEEQFKKQVVKLAATFNKININTERLRQAKALFEAGKIREADAVLKSADLITDQEQLLEARMVKEEELETIKEQLRDNANEFLIKAQLRFSLKKENANWVDEAIFFFERSIQSEMFFDNLSEYAVFLMGQTRFQEAIEKTQRLLGLELSAIQEGQALRILGEGYFDTNQFDLSFDYHNRALSIFRTLAESGQESSIAELVAGLQDMATLYVQTNDFEQAQALFEEGIPIIRELVEINEQKYLPLLVTVLYNKGNFLTRAKDLEAARAVFEEASQVLHKLMEMDPQAHEVNMALLLNAKGVFHADVGEFSEAYACYEKALEHFRQLAEVNPQAYFRDVALTLSNMGSIQEKMANYASAQSSLEEAIQILRMLVEQSPEVYSLHYARAIFNQAFALKGLGKTSDAITHFEQALQIRRQVADENPEAYLPDVARTLATMGSVYREITEFELAQNSFEEALGIYEELKNRNPVHYQLMSAKINNDLGFLYKDQKEFEAARVCHEKAKEISLSFLREGVTFVEIDVAYACIFLAELFIEQMEKELSLSEAREAMSFAREIPDDHPAKASIHEQLTGIFQYWGVEF